ncbi:hypothetical protein BC834DRAFT_972045 [Gloeopeniophorella convolvens]|nr:hypothetical protein BC834DRAFT_972045 [Gloeopeniophorella convolvens]
MPARPDFVRRSSLDTPRRPRKKKRSSKASHIATVDIDDMELDADANANAEADVEVDSITTATQSRLDSCYMSCLPAARSEDLRTEMTEEKVRNPRRVAVTRRAHADGVIPYPPLLHPTHPRSLHPSPHQESISGASRLSSSFTLGAFPSPQPQQFQQQQSGGEACGPSLGCPLNVGMPAFRPGDTFTLTLPPSAPMLTFPLPTPAPAPAESGSEPARAQQGRMKHQRRGQYNAARFVLPTDTTQSPPSNQLMGGFAGMVSALQDKTNNIIDLHEDMVPRKPLRHIDSLTLEGYINQTTGSPNSTRRSKASSCSGRNMLSRSGVPSSTAPQTTVTYDGTRPSKRVGDKQRGEKFLEGDMTLKPIVHEIRTQNQVISLDPPIKYGRRTRIQQLHDWRVGWLLDGSDACGDSPFPDGTCALETLYTPLLTQFSDDTPQRPFALIEAKVQWLKDYASKWLRFQSLWNPKTEYVFNRLGDSLAHWQRPLTEIKRARDVRRD